MDFDNLASDVPLPDEGSHTATLVFWGDRGIQQGKFGGRRQVRVQFELPDAGTPSGEPVLLRSKVCREMSRALMATDDLKGLRLNEMIGKSCKVTVVHRETESGQTFANIASFKALKPGTKVRPPESDLVFFSLDPADVADLKALETAFAALPEYEQKKVAAWELVATLKHTNASKGKSAAAIIDDGYPGNLQ